MFSDLKEELIKLSGGQEDYSQIRNWTQLHEAALDESKRAKNRRKARKLSVIAQKAGGREIVLGILGMQ